MRKVKNSKLRLILLFAFYFSLCDIMTAQVILFSENFGVPNSTTLIHNYTGWQNPNAIYTGNGTCDVRSSSASSGYDGASGGGNVLINDTVKWFMISGINTLSDTNISLYCGLRKTAADNGLNFVVEVSSDSTHWTRLWLEDTLPAGTGTSGWYRVRYPHVISCNNLHVRFSNLAAVEYRLDDVTIVVGEEIVWQTVAKPTFSPTGGTYYEPKTVTITSSTPSAEIYYTMDGSTPTASSNLYQGPLTISSSVTLKAIATHDTMYDSNVASANYVILDTNALVILPFDISTNSNNERLDITQLPGFRAYYMGASYADGSAKFETAQAGKAAVVAHLDSAPESLSFELKGKNGGSNPSAYTGISLEVSESANGQQWSSLVTLSENDINVDDFVRFDGIILQEETRFVRWKLLTSEKGNTQLNNIAISKHTDSHSDSTAIIDYNLYPFSVYPNPTSNVINYDAGTMTILSLVLTNLNGTELRRWQSVSKNGSISITDFPDGMYILKIVTDEGTMLKKIVKY